MGDSTPKMTPEEHQRRTDLADATDRHRDGVSSRPVRQIVLRAGWRLRRPRISGGLCDALRRPRAVFV
jgi:hypothetical protein